MLTFAANKKYKRINYKKIEIYSILYYIISIFGLNFSYSIVCAYTIFCPFYNQSLNPLTKFTHRGTYAQVAAAEKLIE